MSGYREREPRGQLRDLVECAWQARPTAAGSRRVLPDGCMDLIVLDGRIVVAGPDTSAHLAASGPASGLRFRPGALPALLGVPAEALRNQRVDLDDVLDGPRRVATSGVPDRPRGTAPADVPDELRSAPHARPRTEMQLSANCGSFRDAGLHLGDGDVARLVRTALALRDAEPGRLPAPLPRPALHALAGGMPAAALADLLGVTTRTLHRRCLATLGYGPSVARRVLRFRTASALLSAGLPPAQVAARAGYADQPHLSREVRALAGLSPTALATRS